MAYKDLKERLENAKNLYTVLKKNGFVTSEMGAFSEVMNKWVKTGEPWKGKINLYHYKKILVLNLHSKAGKDIDSMLKHVHSK